MRGDLVSRPIGEVLLEAKRLFESGVKELLVVSQDTSAYGVDVQYRTGFWDGKPLKTKMLDLVSALNQIAREHQAWVRLHSIPIRMSMTYCRSWLSLKSMAMDSCLILIFHCSMPIPMCSSA
jgi:tRNA A37 methylthiotransferase MiaB